MKVTIVGAGAMGSRFGYMLHQAGNEVTLIDEWPDHLQKIQTNGLTVETKAGTRQVKIPACLPGESTESPDLMILFTKSMDLKSMLQKVKHLISEHTQVLCLLNGLGHIDTLKAYLDPKHILMDITVWTAGLKGPGHVVLTGSGSLEIQNLDPTDQAGAQKVCEVLNQAGLNAKYSEDVFWSIWRKACVNGTLNSLCTLLDCNIKQLGELTSTKKLIRKIIAEFAAVAQMEGVTLEVETIAKTVEALYDPSQAGAHYPSMHQDLIQKHRLTEIDYINGYVACKGKELAIPTPYNDLLTILIHDKEELLID